MADDADLIASWLFKRHQPSAMALSQAFMQGQGQGRCDVIMRRLVQMGASPVRQALLHVLPYLQAKDLNSVLITDKSMLTVSDDAGLLSIWLMMHAKNGAALMFAVAKNFPAVASYLWKQDSIRADLQAATKALICAVESGYPDCLEILLKHPSPLHANMVDARGRSLLHLAAYEAQSARSVSVVQILLAHGANCTVRSRGLGWTPLFYACCLARDSEDRAGIVRCLLQAQHGLSVIDQVDVVGNTCMHAAAEHGLTQCCQELLSAGSQALTIKNLEGATPEKLAGRAGYQGLQEMLRSAECAQVPP